MWFRSIWFIGIALGMVLALAPNLVWLLTAAVGKIANFRVPYAPFGWTALGLVLLLWAALAYGNLIGRWRSEINEVSFSSPEIPESFDGYRMVHISDLHVDTFDKNPKALQRIVDKVNSVGAQLILFTGDMQTRTMDAVERHSDVLRTLKAPDGILSVLGNHDFFIHEPTYHSMEERFAAADSLTRLEESLGWKVLRNANVLLTRGGESIAIAGVDNINGNQGFRTVEICPFP